MQIYKAEEGFWTRVMSAIAYGLVVAMGSVWLFGALASGKSYFKGLIKRLGTALYLLSARSRLPQ